MLSGTAGFGCFVAECQQCINISWGIFLAVLMKNSSLSAQAHSSKAVVLGDDQISRKDEVHQGKIYTVRTSIKDQSFGTLKAYVVGGVTQD